MKIIHPINIPNNEDGLAVLIPAPEFLAQLEGTEIEKLIHIADKDLPSGTKYELVADDYVPSDRSFRNAWEYVAGAEEKTSHDLSFDDQLKYNTITQEEYDAANG
jgi:hypothetical protein